MITPTRERRDWTLLIFIIPIGIIFMLIAGQVAIRLVPEWSVNAGMRSNLDPNNLPRQQGGLVQPVLPAILTPLGWLETFLTPGADSSDQFLFPSFVVFEPSVTPEVPPTLLPPTAATQPSPTAPTATAPTVVVSPPPVTGTKPPGDEKTPPPPTATPPTATQPTATPPTVVVPPTPVVTVTVKPSDPPALPSVPPPSDIGIGSPDGTPGLLVAGTYTIINLGGNPVVVSHSPDGNYDLIFYEHELTAGQIEMDKIIIGISKTNDGSYYEVFNWGDNERDENTNVDFADLIPDPSPPALCTQTECDNTSILTSQLYTDTVPDPDIHTGILIDVDNAPGKPPEGSYGYLVIISPLVFPGDANAQVDSIVVAEVPIPPAGGTSVLSAEAVPSAPAEEQPSSPPDTAPASPAAEEPALPAEEQPSSPPDTAPASPAAEEPALPVEEQPSSPPDAAPDSPAAEESALPVEEEPSSPPDQAPTSP